MEYKSVPQLKLNTQWNREVPTKGWIGMNDFPYFTLSHNLKRFLLVIKRKQLQGILQLRISTIRPQPTKEFKTKIFTQLELPLNKTERNKNPNLEWSLKIKHSINEYTQMYTVEKDYS